MATQDNGVKSVTIENLEAAFAGESMAHIKYRYFAKLAREAGALDVAKIFEEHGGGIELLDSPDVAEGGRGACIRLWLPALPADPHSSDTIHSSDPEAEMKVP